MHECTIHKRKVKCCGLKKKKKKKKKNLILKRRHAKRRIQTKYIFYKSLVHVGALILFLSPPGEVSYSEFILRLGPYIGCVWIELIVAEN